MEEAQYSNPYAAPAADITPPPVMMTRDEEIRHKFLRHEHNVKSIGIMFLVIAAMGTLVLFMVTVSGQRSKEAYLVAAIVAAFVVIHLAAGIGLRHLRKWAWPAALGLSILYLLALPVGTIMGIVFLFVLGPQNGRFVLSDEYSQIVEATPHIKHKTSLLLLGLLLILLGVLAFGMVAGILRIFLGANI
ncbi:MAG: hypothetical protein KDB27_23555 [Planctomycetales bacterium]|nr:hypothetical protein [Planctomycetales bacterium]